MSVDINVELNIQVLQEVENY